MHDELDIQYSTKYESCLFPVCYLVYMFVHCGSTACRHGISPLSRRKRRRESQFRSRSRYDGPVRRSGYDGRSHCHWNGFKFKFFKAHGNKWHCNRNYIDCLQLYFKLVIRRRITHQSTTSTQRSRYMLCVFGGFAVGGPFICTHDMLRESSSSALQT